MELQEIYDAVRPLWVVWLMVLFSGIIWWALKPGNKTRFEQDAMIPLGDDEQGG